MRRSRPSALVLVASLSILYPQGVVCAPGPRVSTAVCRRLPQRSKREGCSAVATGLRREAAAAFRRFFVLAASAGAGRGSFQPFCWAMRSPDALASARLVRRRHLRPHGAEDLGGQRRVGLDDAAALAGRAPRGEEPAEVLAHALSGHLDQAELRDLEHVGARLVPGERLLERFFDQLPVLLVLHVDEVDDDDAAKVAEPDLADDLAHRLEVDLEHG